MSIKVGKIVNISNLSDGTRKNSLNLDCFVRLVKTCWIRIFTVDNGYLVLKWKILMKMKL